MKLPTPHRDKLVAAIKNTKSSADVEILNEALVHYGQWIAEMNGLESNSKLRVSKMVRLLNEYKDFLEVETIMRRGSAFLKRQKGQLKLDSSVIEEFLVHLVRPEIIVGLESISVVTGPQNTFMSLSFRPRDLKALVSKPEVVVKTKDQDFIFGTKIHYKFSSEPDFGTTATSEGAFMLAVLAAECKVNLDKTMFQEAAGTAARLKQGCPIAQYFILAEYLDMKPEDPRLTAIDNVFLIRHAERLPANRRSSLEAVSQQHHDYPIDSEVIWRFVEHIQRFVEAVWYEPKDALKKGSFV